MILADIGPVGETHSPGLLSPAAHCDLFAECTSLVVKAQGDFAGIVEDNGHLTEVVVEIDEFRIASS